MLMKLCLGTVQLGMNYGVQGDSKPNSADAYALLSSALKYDIRCFDTAGGYGDAEAVLGEFLRQNSLRGIKVISKFSGRLPDQSDITVNQYERDLAGNQCEKVLKDCLKGSLGRLNQKKLDGYLFHNAAYINDAEKLKALYAMKEAGLADNVGISVYTPEEALLAAQNECVDYIQVPYNPLDHRLDENNFFERAKENGKTVFVRSALLQGLLTMNPEQIPDYARHTAGYVKLFQKIAQDYRYTPLKACLAFVKANPLIDYLVFGAAHQKQLEETVSTFGDINEVSADFRRDLRKVFSGIAEAIINPSLWRKDK